MNTNNSSYPQINKFVREYKNADGTIDKWYYDTNISKSNPFKVEIIYPSNFISPEEQFKEASKNIPITQQKFLNPNNGKYVGYTRAKNLGLI